MKVYAAYCKDEKIRIKSSSGGLFSAIANYVISNNGVVFGAKFNEQFEVVYSKAETNEELASFRKSKYVQSKLGLNVLESIEAELATGRMVLFSGTPCHANAVLKYLKKDYDNLYTIDFVCHGTPQPRVWKEYIKYLENKYHSEVTDVDFRDKEDSWKNYSVKINFKNGTVYKNSFREDAYMQAFLSDLTLCGSCYNCKSKGINRNTDITIGDFWGIYNICPEMDDDKGTSLVLEHSIKGEELINKVVNDLKILEIKSDDYVKYNPSIVNSARKHIYNDYFDKRLGRRRFDKLVNDCLHPNYYSRIVRKILELNNK